MALTRVRSRYVVATGGFLLILLGLFPVVGAVIALVPQPVLGGAALVLFGSVTASGIRTLSKAKLSAPFNALIVAGSLGIGLIPVVAPEFYAHFPESLRTILDSGISTGCIVSLLLNLLFTTTRGGTRTALSGSDTGEPATG